jgi:hypothetical protein
MSWCDFFDDSAVHNISESDAYALLAEDDKHETQKWDLVFYNACYGSIFLDPTLSPVARSLYDSYRAQDHSAEWSAFRAINQIGRKESFKADYQKFGFALVEKKYTRWVGKHEYDGMESVGFKLAEYIVDNVRKVLEKQGTIGLEDMKAIEWEGKAVVIYVVD